MFVDLWEKSNNIGAVVCVTLTMKNHMGVYVGQISEVFLYDSPQMWISYYACYDYKMNLISDYSNKKNAKLLVNYSDVEKFEFEFV